ncbi:hypothetical protein [Aliikangiella maris]|uniref:Uncharacterized protein n=2 Tax=Aliikangiella maris TaxID=3162458 RepID=A0ABV2C002_9GAMM
MKSIKLIGFCLVLLLVESITLLCLVFLLNWILSIDVYLKGPLSLVALALYFMLYKCAFELWLFTIVVSLRTKARKIELKDLIIGKAYSGLLMLTVLVFVMLETEDTIDIYFSYALNFVPSVLIAYFLMKKFWLKGVDWMSTEKS